MLSLSELISELLKEENKKYRKLWFKYVLTVIRDKYKVNVAAICRENGVSRQVMYSYINGTSYPSHDHFANTFYAVTDLFEPQVRFESPVEFNELVEFLNNIDWSEF